MTHAVQHVERWLEGKVELAAAFRAPPKSPTLWPWMEPVRRRGLDAS